MLCASGGLTFGLRPNASGLRTGLHHSAYQKDVKKCSTKSVLCFLPMRLLLQKVSMASVSVDRQVVGSIEEGYLLFLGVQRGDTTEKADWLVRKILSLRLFSADAGDHSATIMDHKGQILVVSQFTLAARMDRGTKPDFTDALPGPDAKPIYEYFVEQLRQAGVEKVATGQFGAFMQVSLMNEGPYTLWLDR